MLIWRESPVIFSRAFVPTGVLMILRVGQSEVKACSRFQKEHRMRGERPMVEFGMSVSFRR